MGTKWYKTDFKGVRYRKHPERKHGVRFDQYFVFTYKLDRKTKTEALGWASDGNKASDAFDLLCLLKKNQKTGRGPRTLAEMRDQGQQQRDQARKDLEAQAKFEVSFKDFFNDVFLPDAETRWTPETARKSKEHIKNWIDPVTGSIPMRELGLSHIKKIRAALARKKRSPRQQQYVFRTFSMVWGAARDHGLVIERSPTKSNSFRLPKVDNERQRYLTVDEEKRLLDAIKERSQPVHDIAIVSLDCGLRFKEVAGLTWSCVDLDQRVIRVLDSKGRDRFVPMTDRVKGLFESMEQGSPSDFIFPARGGKRRQQIPSSFVRAVVDAKLNDGIENPKMRASFHTLRHTYASRLVQAGADLYRVQRLLGHSTPIMTARYSKLADADLKQAVKKMERKYRILKEKNNGAKVISFKQAR